MRSLALLLLVSSARAKPTVDARYAIRGQHSVGEKFPAAFGTQHRACHVPALVLRRHLGVLAFRLGAPFLIDHRFDGTERDFHVGDFAHRVVGGDRTGFRRNLDEASLSRQQSDAQGFEFGFHGQFLATG